MFLLASQVFCSYFTLISVDFVPYIKSATQFRNIFKRIYVPSSIPPTYFNKEHGQRTQFAKPITGFYPSLLSDPTPLHWQALYVRCLPTPAKPWVCPLPCSPPRRETLPQVMPPALASHLRLRAWGFGARHLNYDHLAMPTFSHI